MTETQPAVVVGVKTGDLRPNRPIFQMAIREAVRRHAPIRIVHGSDPGFWHQVTTAANQAESMRCGRAIVTTAARQVRRLGAGRVTVSGSCSAANGADALVEASRTASLVLLHAHPRAFGSGTGRGTTAAVAARAACPVLVVRPDTSRGGSGIVVGIDATRSPGALRAGLEAAARTGTTVTVVHAWDITTDPMVTTQLPLVELELSTGEVAAEQLLADAVAPWREQFPDVQLETRAIRGSTSAVLRHVSQFAELVVVGRHADTRVNFLSLGHTTRSLLSRGSCPVLVVPPTWLGDRYPALSAAAPVGARPGTSAPTAMGVRSWPRAPRGR